MTSPWHGCGYLVKDLSHRLRDLDGKLTVSHIPGHNHDVVGHVLADEACVSLSRDGARAFEDGSPPPMQLTLVSSPGVGRDSNGNELRLVTEVSPRYCPLWTVLHDHCFYNLASHKNTHTPSIQELHSIARLRNLQGLTEAQKASRAVQKEIKSLKGSIGHWL